MEDYPRSMEEFERRFSTEQACREYLAKIRWPEGFRCPQCGGAKAWPVGSTWLECTGCHHQTSVTAGTVLQDTRKPLQWWLRAMWYVTSQKHGASAVDLQRALGLRSYQTAWTWLHKLRRAMVRSGRERLRGWVEVDETYIGGQEEWPVGRRKGRKVLVVVAAEADGPGVGRIRLQMIPDASAASLHGFIQDHIEPGSTVHTDAWQGYAGLHKKGYDHEVSPIRRRPKDAPRLLPRVHRVVALLDRWLLGTHQGAVSPQHLPYYLDEFTFRFNRRKSKSRGKLFYRLVQQAVGTPPTSYSHLVSSSKPHPSQPQQVGVT